ncbi:hypothetical protein T484DRAFT_1771574, partial [Baffinella frigidus]
MEETTTVVSATQDRHAQLIQDQRNASILALQDLRDKMAHQQQRVASEIDKNFKEDRETRLSFTKRVQDVEDEVARGQKEVVGKVSRLSDAATRGVKDVERELERVRFRAETELGDMAGEMSEAKGRLHSLEVGTEARLDATADHTRDVHGRMQKALFELKGLVRGSAARQTAVRSSQQGRIQRLEAVTATLSDALHTLASSGGGGEALGGIAEDIAVAAKALGKASREDPDENEKPNEWDAHAERWEKLGDLGLQEGGGGEGGRGRSALVDDGGDADGDGGDANRTGDGKQRAPSREALMEAEGGEGAGEGGEGAGEGGGEGGEGAGEGEEGGATRDALIDEEVEERDASRNALVDSQNSARASPPGRADMIGDDDDAADAGRGSMESGLGSMASAGGSPVRASTRGDAAGESFDSDAAGSAGGVAAVGAAEEGVDASDAVAGAAEEGVDASGVVAGVDASDVGQDPGVVEEAGG